MTLTIELSLGVESRLAAQAAKQGTTTEVVVKELVEQKFTEPRTFDEILAPFRQSVAESGVKEEELDETAMARDSDVFCFQSQTP
jgi:hypothetical protein